MTKEVIERLMKKGQEEEATDREGGQPREKRNASTKRQKNSRTRTSTKK